MGDVTGGFTKKEVVEMYKKCKEVANLKERSCYEVFIGIVSGLGAAGTGVLAYLKKDVILGATSAALAFGSYLFVRDAQRGEKKAQGLEKEIEGELEKEAK